MMAKLWRTCCRTIFCLVLVFGFLPQNAQAFGGFPSRELITRWADVLRDGLIVHLDKYTGIRNLEKTYDDLRKAKLVKLDGLSLVKRMSSDLTENLEKKMAALERLVDAAEEAVKTYKYNPSLEIKDVTFYKMTEFQDDDPNLVYSERLRKNVNYSYSGVHIPVGIFEGYPEILNGLKWSAALDKVFKENLKMNPDLMWQNFGSTAGFMRTYPAKQWSVMSRKPDFPDLYDVRLRPWYVHGSSSPKDMLILMDTSGSMHGQTMEIMKIAVKTLLTTLGEDDFVNVANFSNTAEWVTCFDTFVQANRRNKQVLSEAISNLVDRKTAHLSSGLEFAFQQFEKFEANRSEPWVGAECHKVIMIFSDGGTEEAWDVIEKYNSDKKIRIFAYVVGPHPVPYAALKEIACNNRGFFIEIPAMGAIRANIQDYVKVLSRPIVLSGDKKFQWTNFYLDEMGLGMMTTVTLPVFNKTLAGNQSMVGVMGIDIPLREMWDWEPSYEIGPASYSFGINLNGFVVFHQDLNTEFEYSDEAPLLDFLELEIHHKAKESLRESMINLETGKISITSLVKMPDDRHVVRHRMEYYHTPLNKTSFAIAIVMPNDRTHNLVVDGMEISDGLGIDPEREDEIFLAPWKYCHKTDLSANVSEAVKNISYTLRTKPERCNIALIQRLLWDIRKTEDIAHYWETEARDDKRDGVIATFVQTEGGLTRIYPPRAAHHLAMEVNPYRSNIFQRAFYAEDYVFLVPKVGFDAANNESHEGVTTVVKSISFARTGVTYKPAVVGVSLNPLWLQTILLATPSATGKVPVSCSKTDDIICYLIDDGGFIISTNQPDHFEVIGKFLGYIDAEVMTVLYDKGTFERNEEFNHDDHCKKPQEANAGFRNPIWPFYSVLSSFNFGWLVDMTVWSNLYYWLYSLLGLAVVPNASALPEFFELPNETRCTKHKAQYYLGRWGRSLSGEVHCGNCTRQYSLAKVDQTNLLLLVTTPPCSPLFCDPVKPLLQEPEPDISPDICNRPLRYRRRADTCYADNPDILYSEQLGPCMVYIFTGPESNTSSRLDGGQ